jgi:mRNA interferase MazF
VTLPEPAGSEPGYRRPVLIVQSDAFNQSRIQTVVVVVLTSNLRLAEAPGNVLIPRKESGLPKDSVANVSQMMALDRAFLIEPCHRLPAVTLRKIEEGIRLVLAL